MISGLWPTAVILGLKCATSTAGLVSAFLAWRAAALWLAASKVEVEDTTPQTAVSYDDVPALGILEAQVSGYAMQAAYRASSALNARAARWTAWAAVAAGLATVLSVI